MTINIDIPVTDPTSLRAGDVVSFEIWGTPESRRTLQDSRSDPGRSLSVPYNSGNPDRWFVRSGDRFGGGISNVVRHLTLNQGDRVVLATRYETDQVGRHEDAWDHIAQVGRTGRVSDIAAYSLTGPRRGQMVEVMWDPDHSESHSRVWAGCLSVITETERLDEEQERTEEQMFTNPRENDTWKDGLGDFWIYRGAGWDYLSQHSARTIREQRDAGYVRARGGQGRFLTDQERLDKFGIALPLPPGAQPGDTPEVTALRWELARQQRQHEAALRKLGDKAMILGNEAGMCTTLEQFLDEEEIPYRGIPTTGTVTVTYQVEGYAPRRGVNPGQRPVRIGTDGKPTLGDDFPDVVFRAVSVEGTVRRQS